MSIDKLSVAVGEFLEYVDEVRESGKCTDHVHVNATVKNNISHSIVDCPSCGAFETEEFIRADVDEWKLNQ